MIMVMSSGGGLFILRDIGDHAVGGQEKTGHRTCVLERSAGNLGRIYDSGLNQVLMSVGGYVVAH